MVFKKSGVGLKKVVLVLKR